MSLDPIATIEDLRVRVSRPITTPEDVERAEALLGDASSLVRSITGRPFGTAEYTVRLPVVCGVVRIGPNDVTEVSSVQTITGTELAVGWDGLHRLAVGIGDQFDLEGTSSEVVDVTYTRTGAAAPQWVVALVVQMAARAFGLPADNAGIQSESVASYSYSVGAAAAQGAIGLLPAEEKRLRQAFPRRGSSARIGMR